MQRYGGEKVDLLARRDPPGPMRNTLLCSAPGIEKTLLRAAIGCCQGCPDRPRRKIGSGPEKGRRACASLGSPPTPSRRAIGRIFPVSL